MYINMNGNIYWEKYIGMKKMWNVKRCLKVLETLWNGDIQNVELNGEI